MNKSSLDQSRAGRIVLNNVGESKAYVEDSRSKSVVTKRSNVVQDKHEFTGVTLPASVGTEQTGIASTAGDCPLLHSEDMGVAVLQRETTSEDRGIGFQRGQTQGENATMTCNIIRDNTCEVDLHNEDAISNQDCANHVRNMSNSINDGSREIIFETPHIKSERGVSEKATVLVSHRNSTECDIEINLNNGVDSADGECLDGITQNVPAFSNTRSNSKEAESAQSHNIAEVRTSSSSVRKSDGATGCDHALSTSRDHDSSQSEVRQCSNQSNGCPREKSCQDKGKTDDACGTEPHAVNEGESSATEASPKFEPESEELATIDVEMTPVHPTSPLQIVQNLNKGDGSPATIDVTEVWEDAQSELSRPQFFQGSLSDVNLGVASQPSSQSTPSSASWRTTSMSSTPIEKLTGSNPGSLQEGGCEDETGAGKGAPFSLQNDSGSTPIRSRTSTATSLSTDFSSNISIATDELNEALADGLVLGEDEVEFEEVNLEHGDHPPGASVVGAGAKPKKKGLGGFLARNIFRKSLGKSSQLGGAELSPPGWKLFGRVPAKESALQRDHMQISEDFQKRGQTHPPTSSLTWKKRHTGMKEASSTTALILENRPLNLPAKNPEEEEKHKEAYTQMLKEAKKKELKLYKQKLKKMAQQLKYEDGIKSSLQVWQQEILPRWDEMKKQKKTRELWWQGIPPSVRGRVWMLAIKNELNITHELFEIFLLRAKDRIRMCSESESEGGGLEEIHAASRENSVEVIKLDVARTFPHLCIFQKGGPYFDLLHSVLGAYACYRPDVGYVQGMSFIAAVFLLYLDVADTFICFANLLNKSCQLAFFRLDQPVMQSYFSTFEEYFQDSLPRLYAHFDELGISPDLYIIDWMYTLYSKSLPLDVACRVWDVFFRDGEEFLFRVALGILSLYEDTLLTMDFIQAAQFLTNIPPDIDSDRLFKHTDNVDMHQKKFGQVLMQHVSANLASNTGNS
ncbi:LOW QUALITY PROTEIN: TBC1 domain family member 14-like [Diadema antillarum]|uniref:LOW QUALITY PROTEIN: TBC1 domain family member 14-like n=1 Tax=Diadema antillarum TaxID=105358 RepID=UPI003A881AB7